MSMTLYQSTVGSYIQIIPSILKCFDKGRQFCSLNNIDSDTLVDESLSPSMLPLHFHVIALIHFSEGALNAAKSGSIGAPDLTLKFNYDELQAYIAASLARLQKLDPDDVNAFEGGEVVFKYNEMILPFSTEDFFCTYASPHFFFRATIIYSIFRSNGVPIGIADYIGKVKTTRSAKFPVEVHQHTGAEYLRFLEQLADP